MAASAAAASLKKKGWRSLGSEKEISDENGWDYKPRAQTTVQFDAKRELFIKRRSQQNFITKEASEDSRDVRGTTNPLYDTFRQEVHIGVQAVKTLESASTQTPFYRKVHVCVQAQPHIVDARIQPGKEPETMDPKMKTFVDRVIPRMLHHLLQSSSVPVFEDDYLSLTEEDQFVGSRDDNFLQEKGNFLHATCKGRHVTCVDWRGSKARDDVICVTTIAPVSLVERVELQKEVETGIALVWDFIDPMHPRFILEAPHEVVVIKFNPSRPNIVVGGCTNGQVVMWDLNRSKNVNSQTKSLKQRLAPSHNEAEVKEVPPMPEPVKGHSVDADGDVLISRLQPVMVSRVEHSHKRSVHDLCWLPDNTELAFDGKVASCSEHNQFATVSDDGAVCIWDLRPEHLPDNKLRKLKSQAKAAGEDKLWVPMHKYGLQRPDGSGDVLGFRVNVEGRDKPTGLPTYTFCVGSSDGEFAVCSYAPKDEKVVASPTFNALPGEAGKVIRSLATAHAGPTYAVERHPFIADVYLTCGDWGFKVWRTGLETPIIASPYMEHQITCARWSTTRASVVVVGTADGKVQAWDLLDRSHEPVLVHQLIQDAVTCIAFKPIPEKRSPNHVQYIAIGTRLGTFHWYGLPKVFSKGSSNELRNFRSLLEREVRRVAYFQWRWVERERELDRNVHKDVMAAAGGIIKPKDNNAGYDDSEDKEELEFMMDPEVDQEFLDKVAALLPISSGDGLSVNVSWIATSTRTSWLLLGALSNPRTPTPATMIRRIRRSLSS
ncbi:Hypothetical protein, putative [Bodo saltans]|uniref:Uncharacterized protein n=1 Tax=Bodo saltans TaxID=75058 RepID=A0A0S4JPP6_BODSA|nr:Hypothetical protein, putative [Bodo saltans]|eukprot:CUG91928.1 Hypothetical protein, putative [Bodo saltans]